jgi:hypothetical protein
MDRTDRVQDIHLLIADFVGLEGHHRLHRHETEQLHQMILHHVPERARVIVVAAAIFHAHGFGHALFHTRGIRRWLAPSFGQQPEIAD